MKIDKDGCLKLPKGALEFLDITPNTDLRLGVENDTLIIKKYFRNCIFCKGTINLIGIGEYFICNKCKEKLIKAKDNTHIY